MISLVLATAVATAGVIGLMILLVKVYKKLFELDSKYQSEKIKEGLGLMQAEVKAEKIEKDKE